MTLLRLPIQIYSGVSAAVLLLTAAGPRRLIPAFLLSLATPDSSYAVVFNGSMASCSLSRTGRNATNGNFHNIHRHSCSVFDRLLYLVLDAAQELADIFPVINGQRQDNGQAVGMGQIILGHLDTVHPGNTAHPFERMADEGKEDIIGKDQLAIIAEYGTDDRLLHAGFPATPAGQERTDGIEEITVEMRFQLHRRHGDDMLAFFQADIPGFGDFRCRGYLFDMDIIIRMRKVQGLAVYAPL